MTVKSWQQLKKHILNKHLLPRVYQTEGRFELPKLLPYQGRLPNEFRPYNARVLPDASRVGVYCHIDDAHFISCWNRPMTGLAKVRRYMTAVAPDFTLWMDGLLCENVEQLRRNRVIGLYWQSNGVQVIPSASWGSADSLKYSFDGLPQNSWLALGHQRIGGRQEQRLYQYAVERLIEVKRPIGLIVFGAKLHFNVPVEVRYYPSFITKFMNL